MTGTASTRRCAAEIAASSGPPIEVRKSSGNAACIKGDKAELRILAEQLMQVRRAAAPMADDENRRSRRASALRHVREHASVREHAGACGRCRPPARLSARSQKRNRASGHPYSRKHSSRFPMRVASSGCGTTRCAHRWRARIQTAAATSTRALPLLPKRCRNASNAIAAEGVAFVAQLRRRKPQFRERMPMLLRDGGLDQADRRRELGFSGREQRGEDAGGDVVRVHARRKGSATIPPARPLTAERVRCDSSVWRSGRSRLR